MSEETYTLIVIDGELASLCDATTQSIRYEGISKVEASQLAELSLAQGLTVAAWREGGEPNV